MLALAVTILATGACTGWNGQSLRCRKVTNPPQRFVVAFFYNAPESSPLGARARRSTAFLALHDNGGLTLKGFLPNDIGFRRRSGVLRCQQLALEERTAWIETAERLFSHLGEESDARRAVISVLRVHDSAWRMGVAQSLDRDAQAAARDLACLLVETFGETAMRVMLETSPPLAEWLALPESCTVATSQ
jgi:hypothetical protein